jgi:hypothetical protein
MLQLPVMLLVQTEVLVEQVEQIKLMETLLLQLQPRTLVRVDLVAVAEVVELERQLLEAMVVLEQLVPLVQMDL